MPDPSPDLTLALILSAAGVVPAAALITGLVQLFKTVLGGNWAAQTSRLAAFILSAVLIALAYVTTSVSITLVTGFGAFLAWYAVARLAIATYDDVTANPNSLTGPVA